MFLQSKWDFHINKYTKYSAMSISCVSTTTTMLGYSFYFSLSSQCYHTLNRFICIYPVVLFLSLTLFTFSCSSVYFVSHPWYCLVGPASLSQIPALLSFQLSPQLQVPNFQLIPKLSSIPTRLQLRGYLLSAQVSQLFVQSSNTVTQLPAQASQDLQFLSPAFGINTLFL